MASNLRYYSETLWKIINKMWFLFFFRLCSTFKTQISPKTNFGHSCNVLVPYFGAVLLCVVPKCWHQFNVGFPELLPWLVENHNYNSWFIFLFIFLPRDTAGVGDSGGVWPEVGSSPSRRITGWSSTGMMCGSRVQPSRADFDIFRRLMASFAFSPLSYWPELPTSMKRHWLKEASEATWSHPGFLFS